MKKIKRNILIGLIVILVVMNPIFQFIKSISIMSISSLINRKRSFINELGIHIKIPNGLSTSKKDWYPIVMTFNDDEGFSRFINRKMNYTVLYNFGAFEYHNGASTLYNPDSDYYGAFYGAYFIRELENIDHQFGFDKSGNVNIEEAVLPGTYDVKHLVLSSFGLKNIVSTYHIDSVQEVNKYLDYPNWKVINISITTNGPNHRYKKNHQSYIQYGKPPSKYITDEDFPVTEFKSRLYITYIKEKKCTLFLYIIGPHMKMIEECDKNFLQKSVLTLS